MQGKRPNIEGAEVDLIPTSAQLDRKQQEPGYRSDGEYPRDSVGLQRVPDDSLCAASLLVVGYTGTDCSSPLAISVRTLYFLLSIHYVAHRSFRRDN